MSEVVAEVMKINFARLMLSSGQEERQSRWKTLPGGDNACIWALKDGRI